MTPSVKQVRDVAAVAVLLAVPFFFLRANMKNPENMSPVDRAFLRVAAPVEYAFSTVFRGISNAWQSYVYLVDVKADHEKQAYENARLREALRKAEGREAENQELRRLLQLRDSTQGELVSAVVVHKDPNPFFRVMNLVLDRGSRDLRKDMPVIAPDGVVGRVLSVAGDAVNVQLTVDAGFSGVDVEDVRTKARGYVRGTADPARYSCKVEMVDARDEVQEGDLLVTSGKGKLFPQGIPVAKVTKVKQRELGREQDIEAAPTVDFSRLNTVLVLVSPQSSDVKEEKKDAPKERQR